jgi:tryptophanyl-tRNA synthetase
VSLSKVRISDISDQISGTLLPSASATHSPRPLRPSVTSAVNSSLPSDILQNSPTRNRVTLSCFLIAGRSSPVASCSLISAIRYLISFLIHHHQSIRRGPNDLTTPTNRVLSGIRPTGRLHIGHYFGALQNWVQLQSDPANDCFYFVADWHALTSDYADTSAIAENSLQIAIDYLASGLDPTRENCTIFLQSLVPEHAELHLLLSMVTPLGWLERIPTYKEQIENVTNKDLHTYGFLGYPTLQTADIVMYSSPGKTLSVPVGEDQISHVEFSRELVRRFNYHNGFRMGPELFVQQSRTVLEGLLKRMSLLEKAANYPKLQEFIWSDAERIIRRRVTEDGIQNFLAALDEREKPFFEFGEILTEPQVLLTPTPRIPGLDGRKMSKSYNNAITLSESDADIRSKTKTMVTDPARKRRSDPGNPDICPVFDWHKLFSTEDRDPGRLAWVRTGCTTAGIGCIECKSAMADNLIKWIEPVRERRVRWENNQKGVLEILDTGSKKARDSAKQTMSRVRESIFNWPRKRADLL